MFAPRFHLRTDVVIGSRGGRVYAGSGLAAYSKALELGVASLASNEVVPGQVEIPLTSTTDALAFARQQAEAIAADQALVEAYRRSNAGNFAEAAEFFAASSAALAGAGAAEAQLNEGLQQSNLGNFSEARRLFAGGRSASASSPLLARLLRNYEAMDALNQRKSRPPWRSSMPRCSPISLMAMRSAHCRSARHWQASWRAKAGGLPANIRSA